jgi:hypothetical protein
MSISFSNIGVFLLSLLQAVGKFRHNEPQEFPACAAVNNKGGTDARVLKNVLDHYMQELFPDACDDDDHCIIFKIDGGPGRMNMELLAELRCLGVYLFPGVQNTTHVTQETYQNYSLFKSSKKYSNFDNVASCPSP